MPRVKKDTEWQRGAAFGRDAACELLGKYGRAMVQHNADQLVRHARKRGAVSFDKGYASAYRAAAYGTGASLTCRRR
jgi:hypothetical protein